MKRGPKGPWKVKGKLHDDMISLFEENASISSKEISDKLFERTKERVSSSRIRDFRAMWKKIKSTRHVKAKTDSAVKRVYLKQIRRGKTSQETEVAAARKLACVVWKMLTSKQRYVEEDKYLAARKVKQTCSNAQRVIKDARAARERSGTGQESFIPC